MDFNHDLLSDSSLASASNQSALTFLSMDVGPLSHGTLLLGEDHEDSLDSLDAAATIPCATANVENAGSTNVLVLMLTCLQRNAQPGHELGLEAL